MKETEQEGKSGEEVSRITDEIYAEMCWYSYNNVEEEIYNLSMDEFYKETPISIEALDGPEVLNDWSVIDVYNDEASGVYAVVYTDNHGKAVVAFRGSEPPKNLDFHGLETDWLRGDVELANTVPTRYQKKVEEYLNSDSLMEILEANHVTSVDLTGHSLGGNSAEHGYLTADEDMRELLDACVAFDSPGFSQEYIDTHQKEIELYGEDITEYRYSGAGYLLNDLPNVNYMFIEVERNKWSIWNVLIGCHGLENIKFKHGSIIEDVNGPYYGIILLGELTREIDRMPNIMNDCMVYGVELLIVIGVIDYKYGEYIIKGGLWNPNMEFDGMEEIAFFIEINCNFLSLLWQYENSREIAVEVLTQEIYMLMCTKEADARQFLQHIGDRLQAYYGWTTVNVEVLIERVIQAYKSLWVQLGQDITDLRNQTVILEPNIIVDTNRLRDYAARLEVVVHRIRQLNQDISNLYKQSKLLDLNVLMKEDILQGGIHELQQCINYLYITGDEFEEAENKIMNY